MDLAKLVNDGGWGTYPVILLGGLAFMGGVAALITALAVPKVGKWIASVTLGAVALLLLAGIGGRASGLAQMEAAVAHVNPADKELIRREGYKEAGACVTLALYAAPLPLLLGLLGVGLAWRKPEGRGAPGLATAGLAAASLLLAVHVHGQPFPGRALSREMLWAIKFGISARQRPSLVECGELTNYARQLNEAEKPEPEVRGGLEACVGWLERTAPCPATYSFDPEHSADSPAHDCVAANVGAQLAALPLLDPSQQKRAAAALQAHH